MVTNTFNLGNTFENSGSRNSNQAYGMYVLNKTIIGIKMGRALLSAKGEKKFNMREVFSLPVVCFSLS